MSQTIRSKISQLIVVAIVAAFGEECCASERYAIKIEMRPFFGEKPIIFDSLAVKTPSGQHIAVTRCDFLTSDAALLGEDGNWHTFPEFVGFFNGRGGQTSSTLASAPSGKFKRLRFHIGLNPTLNQSDPSQYPVDHPLNPSVNGLHWGWQGGYVFAAFEGRWITKTNSLNGFSYHIANDSNLSQVELPLELNLVRDQTVTLRFDLSKLFEDHTLDEATSATHSRAGDSLAELIRDKFAKSFKVEGIAPTPTRAEISTNVGALIGLRATNFSLKFSPRFSRPRLPADNPLTDEAIALGRRLFHDTKLSGNKTQSCASCHQLPFAFSDSRNLSVGATGGTSVRNAMPLFNLAWKSSFFWDGRASTLRSQVADPIQNPLEMHATLSEVVNRVAADREYPPLFETAFGNSDVNFDRIARALEQFLLTLVSFDSKFDRAQLQNGGIADGSLTREERRGLDLFNMEFDPAKGLRGADCFHCHGGPLFTSLPFANNGLGELMNDSGRFAVTRQESDRGKFSVPSLRNVAVTAPYMHDGRFATLEEVVEHYDHGVQRGPTLDPNLAKHPPEGLGLSPADKRALVAFLKTLTDEKFISRH